VEDVKVPYFSSALFDIRLTPIELHRAVSDLLDRKRRSNMFCPRTAQGLQDDVCQLFEWYAEGNGPLADVQREKVSRLKKLLERLATVVHEVLKLPKRPFVPHEHCDPILHAALSPAAVYGVEFQQICFGTSLLIIIADDPSWGGGIEVGWCVDRKIPCIILRKGKVSRLLLGIPTLQADIVYQDEDELIELVRSWLLTNIAILV
jgi:hypothetical protein